MRKPIRNKKNNNTMLYEKIMQVVDRSVRKALNEMLHHDDIPNINSIDVSQYEYDDDLSFDDNVIMFLFTFAGYEEADAYNGGIEVDGQWIHVDGISVEDGYPEACIWGGQCWNSDECEGMWDLAVNCMEEILGHEYCDAVYKKMKIYFRNKI